MLFFVMEIKMTNRKRLIIILFISYFFHIKLTIANSLIINNTQVNKINNKNYINNIFIAINKKDWQQVEGYLNKLIKNNYHDKSLIYFIQGCLSYKNREPQSAMHYLSLAITINPHFTRAKLDLSYIYIENRIYHKAKSLLNELIAQQDLPDLVKKKIKYLLILVNNKNPFFATLSLGYHLTDNLNKSPGSPAECLQKNSAGDCLLTRKMPKKITSSGFSLFGMAQQSLMLQEPHSIFTRLTANGQIYRQNTAYNDYQANIYAGYHFQTPQHYLLAGPILGYQQGEEDPNAYDIGGKIEWRYRPDMAAKLDFILNHQFKWKDYYQGQHNNGLKHETSFSINYPFNNMDWYLSLGFSQHFHQWQINDYHRYDIGGGVKFRSLPYLETSVSSLWNQYQFKHFDNRLGAKRRDTEWIYAIKLKLTIKIISFTPSITFFHRKNNSNVGWLYRYQKNDLQLNFERYF